MSSLVGGPLWWEAWSHGPLAPPLNLALYVTILATLCIKGLINKLLFASVAVIRLHIDFTFTGRSLRQLLTLDE